MTRTIALLALTLLAACGGSEEDDRPRANSVEELENRLEKLADRTSEEIEPPPPRMSNLKESDLGPELRSNPATVAAQGYRFRVPYGTLLCVSDKPLHGEIKLPGQANAFYERAISQHLRIGIETLRILKNQGGSLHSRKLRSFDEPPFR